LNKRKLLPLRLTTPKVLKNFENFQSWLDKHDDKIKYVSFDVFDTLLFRCVEPPEAIHYRVACILSEKLKIHTPDKLLSIRERTVSSLRKNTSSLGLDFECKFNEIIRHWVKSIVGNYDQSLIDFITKTELELESLALMPKPGVSALLQCINNKKIKCIALSDMYLSTEDIRGFLNKFNLEKYFSNIFVSSDFGLCKGSGRLHKKVLDILAIEPSSLVHIGDNKISDMWAPLKLGINGIFFRERHERLRRMKQSLTAEMAKTHTFIKGYRLFEIVNKRIKSEQENINKPHPNFFYEYGINVLGPAFSTFILGITEQMNVIKPDKILFLARDGYIFHKMFEKWFNLEKPKNIACKWEYIYTSRTVVASASIADGLSVANAKIALYNPKQQGLLSILKTFGLKPEDFVEKAKVHGISNIEEPIHDFEDKRLKNFLDDKDVQVMITASGRKAKELMEIYLEQLGFFTSKRVALVDIGWNGTIQKFLNTCFSQRTDLPEIHGWYFAFSPQIHGDLEKSTGFLMSGNSINNYDRAPLDYEEIFEQAARSSEATTIRYKNFSGEVKPILKDKNDVDRINEIKCNRYIDLMQQGIQRHMIHFWVAVKLTGYNFEELKPYVSYLIERAVAYPSNKEVNEIGKILHSEDMGQSNLLSMTGIHFGFMDLIQLPKILKILKKQTNRYAVFGPFPALFRGLLLRFCFLKRK
jgi:predicted HAD superfamily hydrolase